MIAVLPDMHLTILAVVLALDADFLASHQGIAMLDAARFFHAGQADTRTSLWYDWKSLARTGRFSFLEVAQSFRE